MTALAVQARRPDYDPVRDKRYREALLAEDVAAWLSWMDLGGARERTLDSYERDLARVCLMYPNLRLEEFTDAELLHVIRSWPAGSRRVRAAAVQSFFKWALRTRRIDRNPCDLLPIFKRTPQKYLETFTDADVAAMGAIETRDAALLLLLVDAGLRKGEARMLRARRANLDTRRVVVLDGKGGRDRVIPMTNRLAVKLAELYLLDGVQRDDFLWYSRPGGGRIRRDHPIGDTSFDRWYRQSLRAAGVVYQKPHACRHTFATSWRRRGLDLDEIQLLLGHASISTTSDLYVHTDVEDVAAHMAMIEGGAV